jgi:predicted transcriptional regulator
VRRSKLEVYVDVLRALAHGPQKTANITQKANVNSTVLRNCLTFLLKEGLIEKISYGRKTVYYEINYRGASTLQQFNNTIKGPNGNRKTTEIQAFV